MKLILGQAGRSLVSGIALTLVIVLMFSVGQFLLIGCASYFNASETKLTDFYTAYSDDELRLRTNPISIYAYNAYADLGMLEEYKVILQKYVRAILNRETEAYGFEQYVFNRRSAQLASFRGTDRCIDEFEEGTGIRDAWRIGDEYYTSLKTYCITPGVFEKFHLKTCAGTDFSDWNDFTYRAGMTVPIVMGYEYYDYYSVGDRIRGNDSFMLGSVAVGEIADTVFSELVFEVVGFLEPGTAILDPDGFNTVDPIGLDQFVLMPFLDYTDLFFTGNENRVKMYLMNVGAYTQGVAVVPKGSENRLEPYYDSLGLDRLPNAVTPLTNPIMIISGIFKLEARNYFKTLMATAGLIVVSATLCLAINMTNKLLASFKTYAIHQISGGTVSDVRRIMAAEGIILILISDALAVTAAFLFGTQVFTYSQSELLGMRVAGISPLALLFALGVSVLILFCSLLVPFIKINRVEFDTLLRGRE